MSSPPLFGVFIALAAALAAIGYGTVFTARLRIDTGIGERGLLGIFGFGLIGNLAHFFVPLGLGYRCAVLLAGFVLFIVYYQRLTASTRVVLCALAALASFALVAPWAVRDVDLGSYYLQTMKWNRELPIIVGLGNLYGRLGFNSFYFLIAAIAPGGFEWIPNVLAACFLTTACFERLACSKDRQNLNRIYLVYVTLAFAIFALSTALATYRPDSFVRGVVIYWTALAIEHLTNWERAEASTLLLILLAIIAVMVKLSAAPLVICTTILLACSKRVTFRQLGVHILAASVALSLWVIRGVLLTGCFAYPFWPSCITRLSWTVALENAHYHELYVKSFARAPTAQDQSAVLANWNWFWPWAREQGRDPRVLVSLLGVAVGITAVIYARIALARSSRPTPGVAALLFGCLIYWFVMAPDVRFAAGFIVSLALLGFSAVSVIWVPSDRVWKGTLVLCLLSMVGRIALWAPKSIQPIPSFPKAIAYQFKAEDGSVVWVPAEGQGWWKYAICWDHALPCTGTVHPGWLGRIRWKFRSQQLETKYAPPHGWAVVQSEGAPAVAVRR